VLALVIAAEGIPEWGPLPLIAGEIAALLLLSGAALRLQAADARPADGDAVAVSPRDARSLH
jgi:hypothetical protein